MIFDFILSCVFGLFEFIFDLLPIPAIPSGLQDLLNWLAPFFAKAAKMISFLFPADRWPLLVSVTKDLFIVRFAYDIYSKFHKHTT